MIGRSHLFSDMRNSVGGITYTANRYAAIVGRARICPVNVNSNPLELMRTNFCASVTDWKGLTDAQRDAWSAYAANTPWTNALGERVYLTGQAMYIAQTTARIAADPSHSRTTYQDCPCVPGLFTTPLLEYACCANPDIGVVVTATNQHHTNTADIIVRRSPPLSPGVKFYNGPWDNSASILLSGIAPASSDDAEFCDLCEARYAFEARAFDATDDNNMSTLVHGYFDACTTAP